MSPRISKAAEKRALKDVGMKDWTRDNILLSFLIAAAEFGMLVVGTFLFYLLFNASGEYDLVVCGSCQLYWLSFPYQFLAVGFAEEIFFRGYIYTKLRLLFKKRHGETRSFILTMVITNVLFGLFHVPW